MFRFADACLFSFLASGISVQAHAQSIGDYSRAQRAVIESAIARNGTRTPPALPGLAPPASPPASVPAAALAPPPTLPPAPKPAEPSSPELSVTGVFISASVVLAEVVVEGAPFILSKGQRVPGTEWVVARVEPDKVVLSAEPRSRTGKPASRTFLLAAEGS